jgi:uncharacterized alpha-E superfamily protein
VLQSIADRGIDFVAQEAVTLSTTPVWRGDHFEPRPFILRVFLARVGDTWTVMPGGFVRVAEDLDARAVSLQKGGRSADAWVLSDVPVADTSLLPAPDRVVVRRASGILPSRAADNLFWVGRYVERVEATLRLIRALMNRVTDADEGTAPIIASISSLLIAWEAGPTDLPTARPALIARAALQGEKFEGSLRWLARAARYAASVIRDRFPPDAWRALTGLVSTIEEPLPAGPAEGAIIERANDALRIVSSFSGLAQENMTQLAGWRFLELGRRIERAIATCRFVRRFASPPPLDGALDVLLELCDSQITYRQRYVMVAARAPAIDLVVLDPHNPRSIAYQLDRIEQHLGALPQYPSSARVPPTQQLTMSITTALRTADVTEIDNDLIMAVEDGLMTLSEAIAAAYLARNERSEGEWGALA